MITVNVLQMNASRRYSCNENCEDADQTAPFGAVWSGSALFVWPVSNILYFTVVSSNFHCPYLPVKRDIFSDPMPLLISTFTVQPMFSKESIFVTPYLLHWNKKRFQKRDLLLIQANLLRSQFLFFRILIICSILLSDAYQVLGPMSARLSNSGMCYNLFFIFITWRRCYSLDNDMS